MTNNKSILMKSPYLFIFIVVLLTMFNSCKSDQTKALEHYDKAKKLFKVEKFSAASKELDKGYVLDSTNLNIQLLQAQILKEEEKYETAIDILKSLTSKSFKPDTVQFEIGRCYYSLGTKYSYENKTSLSRNMLNYALIHLSNAIKKNDKYREAYISKYRALHNLEKYEEAIILLNSINKIFPNDMEIICYKGIEKNNLGDVNGALIDLNMVIINEKENPSILADAYRFRGILYRDKGENKKAIDDLTNSLKYNSDDPLVYNNRAEIYIAMGKNDKACEDFRTAADLGIIEAYESIKKYCNDLK